jgi:hypothetical protein
MRRRPHVFASFALAAVGLALAPSLIVGCGKEKVIIIREPAAATGSADGKATPIATDDGQRAGDDGQWGIMDRNDSVEYQRTIDKVATMVSDADLVQRVSRRRLAVVNVNYEDTGRAQGSSVGPNITDLTLQVRRRDEDGRFVSALMPVIRFPNFSDRTGDVPADKFFVRVGNEQQRGAGSLRTVALTEVLKDVKAFASLPQSLLGDGNLLAPRDSHFLVSAQAVFLPIPKKGKSEFNPVLFNYQSAPGSPAVLSILITREGTSMQVVENRGEDLSSTGSGQEIYFNNKGQKSAFTAERKADVEQRIAAQGGPKTENDRSALAKGADTLFLVQVPLMHRQIGRMGGAMDMAPSGGGMGMGKAGSAPAPTMAAKPSSAAAPAAEMQKSDVEQAVLGHGPNLGPFNEGHNLRLVRDPKFPIRITVQFYKATSNGVVSDQDLDSIARSIGSVYEHADFVGSLVVPEGDPRRPTSWQRVPHEWFPW